MSGPRQPTHEALLAARAVLWKAKQAGNFDTFDVTEDMLTEYERVMAKPGAVA